MQPTSPYGNFDSSGMLNNAKDLSQMTYTSNTHNYGVPDHITSVKNQYHVQDVGSNQSGVTFPNHHAFSGAPSRDSYQLPTSSHDYTSCLSYYSHPASNMKEHPSSFMSNPGQQTQVSYGMFFAHACECGRKFLEITMYLCPNLWHSNPILLFFCYRKQPCVGIPCECEFKLPHFIQPRTWFLSLKSRYVNALYTRL